MDKGEIARLRQQIEAELEAMQRGLYGFAAGSARHAFINARMERIGAFHDSLTDRLGEAAAGQMVCMLYMQTMEADNPIESTQ